MVIRPSDPDRPQRLGTPGTPGTDAAAAAAAARRDESPAQATPSGTPTADRAEVSSEARELLARLDGSADAPAIAPEKLRAVLDRIRSGHYDRPEVLDQVAKRARADVTGPRSDH